MICCPPHYPDEAPIPYVRPTAFMVIRERHKNVRKEGRVYLPHYQSVRNPQFTLYGLMVVMIRVFANQPPVNARLAVWNDVATHAEKKMIFAGLTTSIAEGLSEANNDAVSEMAQFLEWRKELVSEQDDGSMDAQQREEKLKEKTDELDQLNKKRDDLLRRTKSMNDIYEEKSVDETLPYRDILFHQTAENMATKYAYRDALDQVHEGLVKGMIDHDSYMLHVRSLSRKQFFCKELVEWLEIERKCKQHMNDTSAAAEA